MKNLNQHIENLKLAERNRCITLADELFFNDIMPVDKLIAITHENIIESINKMAFWATYQYTHQIKAKFLDEKKLVADHDKRNDFIKGLRSKIQDELDVANIGNITLLIEYKDYEKPYTIDIKFTLNT